MKLGGLGCDGDEEDVIQGRKSFPSGHSSYSFATFGFVFLYFSAKMKTFAANRHGTDGAASAGKFLTSVTLLLGKKAIDS